MNFALKIGTGVDGCVDGATCVRGVTGLTCVTVVLLLGNCGVNELLKWWEFKSIIKFLFSV